MTEHVTLTDVGHICRIHEKQQDHLNILSYLLNIPDITNVKLCKQSTVSKTLDTGVPL